MDSATVAAAGLGITLVLLLLFIRWRWRTSKVNKCSMSSDHKHLKQIIDDNSLKQLYRTLKPKGSSTKPAKCKFLEQERPMEEEYPLSNQVQLVHRLCPHHNVIQSFEVEQKDSLDEHLDVLTRKLAEKEGRLRLSKSKIRETQNEIENLQAIDQGVRFRYREIMDSLRSDLLTNEKECRKLQERIEWVSRRRAEIREEVRRGQKMYGEAAAELASNLVELQRGRGNDTWISDNTYIDVQAPDTRVNDCLYPDSRYADPRFTDSTRITDKPQTINQTSSIRHRKEPQLPQATPVSSLGIKSPPGSPHVSRVNQCCEKKKADY